VPLRAPPPCSHPQTAHVGPGGTWGPEVGPRPLEGQWPCRSVIVHNARTVTPRTRL